MSAFTTKPKQLTPNLSPAGQLAAFGTGDNQHKPLAVAVVGDSAYTLQSSFAGAGGAPTTAVAPLTPDSSPTNHPSYIQHAQLSSSTAAAAPSFLQALFPSNALEATAVSKEVLITSNGTSRASWHGALLDANQVPGSPVLLVGVPVAEGVEIRQNVEILLDLASDHLDCSTLIFVLDKSSPDLRELVHGLLFIGGTIVQPHARNGWEWKVDGGKVLIGMEL